MSSRRKSSCRKNLTLSGGVLTIDYWETFSKVTRFPIPATLPAPGCLRISSLELVLRILLAVIVVVGLITVIMSVKNWHWAQMLLLLAIFFSGIGSLVLGLEVYRIHRNIRREMPGLEDKLAEVEQKNEALKDGTRDEALAGQIFAEMPFNFEAESRMPGMGVWTRRLQDQARQRGRVWRGVTPTAPIDPTTQRVPVSITQPQPSGLEQDAIVYMFEQGEPNAADPGQGAQYLGEFRVVEARPDGATLEAVIKLDDVTGARVLNSQKPWALYETMPADRHELYAGLTEEELRQRVHPASVDEYIRHGTEAPKPNASEAFDPTIMMVDEAGRRVGPDDAAKAQKWLYERQLRDYAYLFSAANRHYVELRAHRDALQEDLKKLAAANAIAEKFGAQRTEEKQALAGDLEHMEQDRQAAETLLANVQSLLANAGQQLTAARAENTRLAAQLAAEQLKMLEAVNSRAPAAESGALLTP